MKLEYPIRLQAYMAKSGCGSRRFCETLITAGRVTINTKRVTELGTKVNEEDVVMVDDQLMRACRQDILLTPCINHEGNVCTNTTPMRSSTPAT